MQLDKYFFPIGKKAACAERMQLAREMFSRLFACSVDHGPMHPELEEGGNEPDFHEVQKAESSATVDWLELTSPQRIVGSPSRRRFVPAQPAANSACS